MHWFPKAFRKMDTSKSSETREYVKVEQFGVLETGDSKGKTVSKVIISNENKFSIEVCTMGATLLSVNLPSGKNVVLNNGNFEGFMEQEFYLGATCGRVANRIANGKFILSGQEYNVSTNQEPNHLHGGFEGFNRKIWKIAGIIMDEDEVGAVFQYVSKDGEEGYPGELIATACYSISIHSQKLNIKFSATTDKETIVNMCNHAYWNLNGTASETDILNHTLRLQCNEVLEVDDTQIPTGKKLSIVGTPFDFRNDNVKIGTNIKEVNKEHGVNYGYDHCYVQDGSSDSIQSVFAGESKEIPFIASLTSDDGSCTMNVATSLPGVQVYTANWLPLHGKSSLVRHGAVCLETQNFPDAINKMTSHGFPNCILRPGDVYEAFTIHEFLEA